MLENYISYLIRGSIYEVYKKLGPGLLESVYQKVLEHELQKRNLTVKREVSVPVIYDNVKMDIGFRLDLLVNEKVIIEIKSVETLAELHHKQVLTYLKLTGLKLAILVNFNTLDINNSIYRKVNGL